MIIHAWTGCNDDLDGYHRDLSTSTNDVGDDTEKRHICDQWIDASLLSRSRCPGRWPTPGLKILSDLQLREEWSTKFNCNILGVPIIKVLSRRLSRSLYQTSSLNLVN